MPSNAIYPRGTILQERYRIIEAVGTGGYGVVYKAEDTRYHDYLVAVKSINLAGLSTQEVIEATEAFNREVLMLSQLRHFSLPAIHDHFTDAEHWYMVMDFIEGETLENYIAQADMPQNGTRCLPLLEVLEIGMQLCTVLGYLHTQVPSIIFRDLKPANVMRMSDGHLYLIDFGIARHFKHGQAKDTIPLGSPGYAAPEQYGRTQTTPRSDIYSLGALLHQLISGDDPSESPFHFAHLLTVDNPILTTLDELLLQMVEKDERNRPASVTTVKQRLQQIRYQAMPPRVVAPPVRPRKGVVSRRVFVGTLATVLVAGALVKTLPISLTEQGMSASDSVPVDVPSAPYDSQGTQITLYTYQNPTGPVTALAWSPGGNLLASGDENGNVYVWRPTTGEPLQSLSQRQLSYDMSDTPSTVQSVSWSPDGQQLAIAKSDATIYIWDIRRASVVHTYENSMDFSGTVWSPNGKYIAASNFNFDIQIYDAGTTRQVSDLHSRDGYYDATIIIWSPDSRVLASVSPSALLTFWDIVTGRQLYGYSEEIVALNYVNTAAWSPNGKLIVLGGLTETHTSRSTVLSTKTYPHKSILNQDTFGGDVVAASWSPDSTRIASTYTDATVEVWDASTGQTILTYTGHTDHVNAVSWSPDGTLIASGGDDMTVQVWKS